MVEGRQFVAPSLFRYEVTNALYRYQHAGVRTPEATSILLAAALALPIEQLVAPGLHQAAVRFATRFRLPAAYYAHYLALADHLGCEFWTGDRKLVKTIGTSLPWVRLVDVIPRNSTDSAG